MQSVEPVNEAEFLRHTSCEVCGSSDANGVYSDGHTFCFSCNTYKAQSSGAANDDHEPREVQNQGKAQQKNLLQGEAKALAARNLTEETCRRFDYIATHHNNQPVQAALYRDKNGRAVAQKVRTRDKSFFILGDAKAMTLFGSHLWNKGKKLVVCEGEVDTMSCSQIQNHKWPVVGLSHGAPSAVKTIKKHWDYLMNFDEIVLMFDMDQAGQEAAEAVAQLLPVGKAKIAYLPCKDVNDCLVAGKSSAVIEAIFQAREYRPDGTVAATDFRDVIGVDETASSISYPYSGLNRVLLGIRPSELVLVAAGSGTGKTTFVKELAYHLHQSGEPTGLIMLEESNKRTLLGLTGIHMNKNILVDRSDTNEEEITAAFEDLFGEGKNPVFLYDHFGASSVDIVAERITYMAKSLGVRHVILDHISILCTQMGGAAGNGSERLLIDYAMTKLRTLVQSLGISLVVISHTRRPDGNAGHERGQEVTLSHLRGSTSLAGLSDAVIALQVDPDEPDSDIRHLHILKNRFTGERGPCQTLVYSRDTGRLLEMEVADLVNDETEEGEADASS